MNTIAEMKNTLEGINSRLGDTEECISHLKDQNIGNHSLEQEKENKFKK